MSEGAIRIAELRGGQFDLRGVLSPDTEWRRFALNLTGSVAVTDALLRALGAPEAIHDAAGVLALEELRTVLPAADGESAPFSLRAQLVGGALRIATDAVEDTLSSLEIGVSGGGGEALRVEARARSAALGPVSASAALEPAAGRARGTLAFDPAAAAGLLRNASARRSFAQVLQAYGGGGFDFQVERSADTSGDIRVRIESTRAPRVTAVARLPSEGNDVLQDVDVEAQVPASALRPVARNAQTSGRARAAAPRGSDASFTAEANLDALGVRWGSSSRKGRASRCGCASTGRPARRVGCRRDSSWRRGKARCRCRSATGGSSLRSSTSTSAPGASCSSTAQALRAGFAARSTARSHRRCCGWPRWGCSSRRTWASMC